LLPMPYTFAVARHTAQKFARPAIISRYRLASRMSAATQNITFRK
jgi:hypothetical protein